MTRRREKVLNAKSNPVALFAARIDLSDLPERHRVTNATTTGSYSQKADWANSALRPGCLDFKRFKSRSFGCSEESA